MAKNYFWDPGSLWDYEVKYRRADLNHEILGCYSLEYNTGDLINVNDFTAIRQIVDPLPDPTTEVKDLKIATVNEDQSRLWRFDNILRWKKHVDRENSDLSDRIKDVNVFTQRGVLKYLGKLMILHYQNRIPFDKNIEEFEFEVCKYKGKLYLRRHRAERETARHPISPTRAAKLEELITSEQNGNVSASFQVSKMSVKDSNFTILFSSQIDAVNGENEVVEIKLHQDFGRPVSEKHLKVYWLQCFLSGIRHLVYGYYSGGNGVLTRFVREEFNDANFPRDNDNFYNKVTSFIFDIIERIEGEIEGENKVNILRYSLPGSDPGNWRTRYGFYLEKTDTPYFTDLSSSN